MKQVIPSVLIAWLSLLAPCLYSQTVVINEVQVKPPSDAISAQYQSMFNCPNPTFGAEWVELYNPSPCNAVNLTGYILGARTIATNFGAVMLPAGTSIPPLGFLVLGGPNAPNVDLNLTSLCATSNICTDGDSRWYMENGDGWVALYNPSGTPVDAVYWTFSSGEASKLTTDGDFASSPCTPAGSAAGSLAPAASMGGLIGYAGAGPSINQTVYRTSDGGTTWANNGTPTPKACNAACSALTCSPLAADEYGFGGIRLKGSFYFYWYAPAVETCHSYLLERSEDLETFQAVVVLPAMHQPSGPYHHQLAAEDSPAQWFRLAALDANGDRTWESQIISLGAVYSAAGEIQAGPNPTNGDFNLFIPGEKGNGCLVQLTDLQGKVISEKKIMLNGEIFHQHLDLAGLPPGVYLWKVISPAHTCTGKIILAGQQAP